jgi:hypothetical protein
LGAVAFFTPATLGAVTFLLALGALTSLLGALVFAFGFTTLGALAFAFGFTTFGFTTFSAFFAADAAFLTAAFCGNQQTRRLQGGGARLASSNPRDWGGKHLLPMTTYLLLAQLIASFGLLQLTALRHALDVEGDLLLIPAHAP